MAGSKQIFLVEDDRDVRAVITSLLESKGYAVQEITTGREAKDKFAQQAPDLCIVDLGLPDMDGMTLVRELRSARRLGLIVLTARHELEDRVSALELGADDYVTKPFEPTELLARVCSVLRRCETGKACDSGNEVTYRFGKWAFAPSLFELSSGDRSPQTLTAAEANLLMVLLRNPNRILSREQLQGEEDWPDEVSFERSIDVRISRLRKKIEEDPRSPKFIKTVYGAGYLFASKVRLDV